MGVGLSTKQKDLSASEREERGHGKGVGVYATLLQSDTVQPYVGLQKVFFSSVWKVFSRAVSPPCSPSSDTAMHGV